MSRSHYIDLRRGRRTRSVRWWLLLGGMAAQLAIALCVARPEPAWEQVVLSTDIVATRPATLAEIFALIEVETGLKVTYPPGEIALGSEIVLQARGGTMSLGSFLELLGQQGGMSFSAVDGQIVARPVAAAKPVAVASPAAVQSGKRTIGVARAAPRPAYTAADWPARVAEVRQDAKMSTARKEKVIFAIVRQAVAAATSQLRDEEEAVAVAAELARSASHAAPQFVEVIANSAAFTPAVAKIRQGTAQVRAAAYAGLKDEPPAAYRPPAYNFEAAPLFAVNDLPPVVEADGESGGSGGSGDAGVPVLNVLPAAQTETRPVAASPTASQSAATPAMALPAGAEITFPGSAPSAGATPAVADNVIQMDAFKVEGTATRGSASDLRVERVKAAVSVDTLSSDQFAKFSAGDLSEIVFRIPGVSVEQGQFAVVRGLSDRFLSTTLQGIKLPTPDPERQAVQLDLLPASAVEAVVVAKTFESSQWAESAGGNMDVRTRAIPTENQFNLSFGLSGNSNAADGGPHYVIRGSRNEGLGFGSRSRLDAGTSDPTWQYVPTHRQKIPMGKKVSFEFARAYEFGEQKLGLLLTGFNDSSYKTKTGRKQAKGAQGGTPATEATPATSSRPATPGNPGRPSEFELGLPTSQYVLYDYTDSVSDHVLGVTAALGYRFSAAHELKLTGLFVQSGIDEAQVNGTGLTFDPSTKTYKAIAGRAGFAGAEENAWFNTFEYFRERNLTAYQLSGRHNLSRWGDPKVTWALQRGTSYQKDSPFIEANFATPLNRLHQSYQVFGGNDAPQMLKAVWGENRETQKAARLDIAWPLRLWGEQVSEVNFGVAADSTDRATSGVAIDYRPASSGAVSATTPNGAFAKVINVAQGGIATPPTAAEREIRASYVGVNIALLQDVKLVAGIRTEDFSIGSSGSGRWGGNLTSASFYSINPAKGILGAHPTNNPPVEEKKSYPGIGLILGPWKNVTARLHYSKTSGRPSLREISPFFNKSVESGNLVVGNPALKPSDATNYDLRLEWAPNRTDLISFSIFRKDIENPIEKMLFNQTIPPSGDATESWVNNPNPAQLKGLELEFRHSFRTWSELLQDFSLSGNYTFIDAQVGEHPLVVSQLLGVYQDKRKIPLTRRLFDQPESIGNIDVTWAPGRWGTSVTLAAYLISDVLATTGKPSFFDIYERGYTRFDLLFSQRLSAHLKLKASVKNLADPERGQIYDREATSALVERNTYRAGRDYSGSVTYEF